MGVEWVLNSIHNLVMIVMILLPIFTPPYSHSTDDLLPFEWSDYSHSTEIYLHATDDSTSILEWGSNHH